MGQPLIRLEIVAVTDGLRVRPFTRETANIAVEPRDQRDNRPALQERQARR